MKDNAFAHEADVIIIGLGGAGACAAIEAHSYGAKVIILEKQSNTNHYSNTRLSGGGFLTPKLSEEHDALIQYAEAMFSGGNIPWNFEGEQPSFYSKKLAELWIKYASSNINFMQNLDPKFTVVCSGDAAFENFPGAKKAEIKCCTSTYSGKISKEYNNIYNAIDLPKLQQEQGEAFHLCILEGIKKRNIEIHYNTKAIDLLFNDNREIIGVRARSENKEISYKCKKGVILASGGYEYNKEMRKSFLEGPGIDGWAFYGSTENTGDGIAMALKAGAGLSMISKASARLITAVPLRKYGLKIGLETPVIGKPNEIIVDNYGKRYANERRVTQNPSRYHFYKEAVAFDSINLNYPRIPSWLIFDENLRMRAPLVRLRLTRILNVPWSYDNMDAIKRGWILKSNSIRGLAIQIKKHNENRRLMNPGILSDTINTFNNFCKNGKDVEFGRDESTLGPIEKPPYYALPLYAGGPNTKGGLMADPERRVLDWEGNPIKRLYAVGEICSVFQFAYQAGGNLSECIAFGRIAGKTVMEDN